MAIIEGHEKMLTERSFKIICQDALRHMKRRGLECRRRRNISILDVYFEPRADAGLWPQTDLPKATGKQSKWR
jgi:hypothetical protein